MELVLGLTQSPFVAVFSHCQLTYHKSVSFSEILGLNKSGFQKVSILLQPYPTLGSYVKFPGIKYETLDLGMSDSDVERLTDELTPLGDVFVGVTMVQDYLVRFSSNTIIMDNYYQNYVCLTGVGQGEINRFYITELMNLNKLIKNIKSEFGITEVKSIQSLNEGFVRNSFKLPYQQKVWADMAAFPLINENAHNFQEDILEEMELLEEVSVGKTKPQIKSSIVVVEEEKKKFSLGKLISRKKSSKVL